MASPAVGAGLDAGLGMTAVGACAGLPSDMPSAIEVAGLSKRFGPVHAVDDLSFEVTAGRVTGFLGPNGSGKTTTLRMLLGLVSITGGSATFGGRRYIDGGVRSMNNADLAAGADRVLIIQPALEGAPQPWGSLDAEMPRWPRPPST